MNTETFFIEDGIEVAAPVLLKIQRPDRYGKIVFCFRRNWTFPEKCCSIVAQGDVYGKATEYQLTGEGRNYS